MSTDPADYGFTTVSAVTTNPADFEKEVYAYLEMKGEPVDKLPCLDRRTLSLWALFHAVLEFGGSEQVTSHRKWKQVANLLHLPDTLTSASFTLRTYFKQFLGDFEAAYLARHPVIERVGGGPHPAKKRKLEATGWVTGPHAEEGVQVVARPEKMVAKGYGTREGEPCGTVLKAAEKLFEAVRNGELERDRRRLYRDSASSGDETESEEDTSTDSDSESDTDTDMSGKSPPTHNLYYNQRPDPPSHP
ncbi:AT-rich interactive domain-containing protein 3A [Borealophlyctis nickersoniae]|nr:AT-rich interactive domain-containing protein 3A [Borealophlyctis nickersoniae]